MVVLDGVMGVSLKAIGVTTRLRVKGSGSLQMECSFKATSKSSQSLVKL